MLLDAIHGKDDTYYMMGILLLMAIIFRKQLTKSRWPFKGKDEDN
jgi:hypothetical protein